MNPVIDQLHTHRSIRKFTNQQIDQSVIETLITSGQAAATSSFIQACTVIQISDTSKRESLAQMAGNQRYVAEAPIFLVFCADMHRHQLACQMHNAEMQSGFTEQFLTASMDCGLFAQNLVVAAESLGLGSCYIGGLRNQIAGVSDLLELPDLVYPVFGLCLGYPDQNPEVKPRLPVNQVLKQDSYTSDQDDIAAMEKYDEQVRAYYQSRTGGAKDQGWTEQISVMLQKEARPHMLEYLKNKGFLLK